MSFILSYGTIRRRYKLGVDSIIRLVTQLEDRIEDLTALQSSRLQNTVIAQNNEIKRLSRTLEHKSKQLLESQQANHQSQLRILEASRRDHQLQTRIRELEKCLESDLAMPSTRIDSHNSGSPPSLDPPWCKPKRTRSLRQQSGLRVGGQIGHKGVTLLQVANPDVVRIHHVEVCPRCDGSLAPTEPTRFHKRQVFDIIDGRMTVIEHRAAVKLCFRCERRVTADFPAGVKAPVQYGAAVLSRIVYLNIYQLLPVARTAESMRDLFNCPVSSATVQKASNFCAQKLHRSEQKIKAALRNCAVVGADETGIRINAQSAWVHIARNDDLTHLAPHFKRGRRAIEEIGIINRFEGVLVRDGFSSYNLYQQCQHGLCNAHLLRDLTFISEAEPLHKDWSSEMAVLLIKIKDTVGAARAKSLTALTHLQQCRFSNRYDGILTQAWKVIRGSPKKQSVHLSAHNLCRRFIRNKPEILRFMTDFSVPFDNNGAERDLRMLKLQQKISGCFRTNDGATTFCRVRSYLSSARKQGRSLLTAIERAVSGKPVTLTTAV